MSLTVKSCMALPAFRYARIAAGRGGIHQTVNSITVLEYASADVISSDLFLNHEMCLTAFCSIKDNVDAQCAVIRKMKETGICAVVLYYVGIFVPYLDSRLIRTANELDFPLICMPYNRFDLRYGEAISDVLYAIYRNKQGDVDFIPEVLENISELPERLRTVRSLLRIISDRFRCSFFLFRANGELLAEGQWPRSADWCGSEIAEIFAGKQLLAAESSPMRLSLGGRDIFAAYSPVAPEHAAQLHLLAIDEQESMTREQIWQAAELVALFLNISSYSPEETCPEMLIRCMIANEQIQVRELSAKHGIDPAKIQRMWILGGRMESFTQRRLIKQWVSMVRNYFTSHGRWALVDIYQNSVIALFQSAAFAELDETMEEEFMRDMANADLHPILIKCVGIASAQSISHAYELYDFYFDTVRTIYPLREIFDIYDLSFAGKIKKLAGHEQQSAQHTYALQPILREPNGAILLETLAVYLLDAGRNLQRASGILGIHKNTVRYRMNQIRAVYGCDISQMPLAAELYEATALRRLLSDANAM